MSVRILRGLFACAIIAAIATVPLTGVAATATGTLTVTAAVTKTCTLSNATLAFGSYDPIVANRTTDLDQTATMTLTCTKNSSGITLGFGPSTNAPAGCTTPARCMASSGSYLQYQVYSDAAHTTAWTTPISETATGGTTAPTTITIYGRIPSGQDAGVGAAYTDSVVATVNF